MSVDLNQIENRLWAAADQLWANTGLKPSEFSNPVLGLIFLRYAEKRFHEAEAKLMEKGLDASEIEKFDYQADGALYLPDNARFSYLLDLAEGHDLGKAVNEAMAAVEAENEELKGVLPRSYGKLPNAVLVELLRLLNGLEEIEGDAFGKIYEYFLGKFALAEGQKGGVFYTPTSIVKLIVEIIEPYHGKIFDPACGSGGMFVQSAEFVSRHKKRAAEELTVFGAEKANDTVKLAKMNLAVHGLSGDIRESNTYYEDPHKALGKFDFVMANPPFNVSGVDKARVKDDPRFPFGIPTTDNANYLWIQLFYTALNERGRAGFVMANSAGDARGMELEIRKKLIQTGGVDVIVSVGPNFFYTVTLPCTLWFFDKAKAKGDRKDEVLFIDARGFYRQVSRAIRDFLPEQIELMANIVRLWRGEEAETEAGSQEALGQQFPEGVYRNIAGVCKAVTLAEIEAQGWSLNPGRYVGVGDRAAEDIDFFERLEELGERLESLNSEASVLERNISEMILGVLSATK
ncbi:type I restriction-modification system subunit M [Burkholderiaceae bacterium FT117]|uniref:type I restriction-modification system subunit M n=1 Tax=Zeimonas sediminis TaxID=2944268 RepID=UPI0023431CEE|nr:class I SAM-dependent DNA methyltransferase [Zeimonas sediminis]MCM5570495.1 type I restriction-modification system subunit M [Zeimonas sediminis]